MPWPMRLGPAPKIMTFGLSAGVTSLAASGTAPPGVRTRAS